MDKFFECPIGHETMEDPVVLFNSGQTYERKNIVKWLDSNDTDPVSGKKTKKILVTNWVLRQIMESAGMTLSTPDYISDSSESSCYRCSDECRGECECACGYRCMCECGCYKESEESSSESSYDSSDETSESENIVDGSENIVESSESSDESSVDSNIHLLNFD